jgi:hypothetical protein
MLPPGLPWLAMESLPDAIRTLNRQLTWERSHPSKLGLPSGAMTTPSVNGGTFVNFSFSLVQEKGCAMPVFALMTAKGPNWDPSRGNREQPAWDEHAAFFDSLVDKGVVILGGPIGGGSNEDVALARR